MNPHDSFKKGTQTALLLVDVQKDYFKKKLHPPAHQLIINLSTLLTICREFGLPVIHSQTIFKRDGSDRMPHQKELNQWRCVEGTPGCRPPQELLPEENEKVFKKTYYSAFGNDELHSWLKHQNVKHLIIAGLYTHACVSTTILDAYEHGYSITVPEEAVGSEDILHAELRKNWLGSRACNFVSLSLILKKLQENVDKESSSVKPTTKRKFPVRYDYGSWKESGNISWWEHKNPSNWNKILGLVPIGDQKDVDQIVASSEKSRVNWAETPGNERLEMLLSWISELEKRKDQFISTLALEVGKPYKTGRDEFNYGLSLMKEAIRRIGDEHDETLRSGIQVRHCPLGTVALITPWNNPFAIPLGKIIPALAYGNSVVWKPALQTSQTVTLIVDAWESVNIPDRCLNIVFGDATTAQQLARHPDVKAISFTGSITGGRDLSMISADKGIRLQAEMGGNNGVIVGRSADASKIAKELCPSVYSFSGQRCTAPRRLIVAEEIFDEFVETFIESMDDLKIGDPDEYDVQIGPVISRGQQKYLKHLVEEAKQEGATLIKGGTIPREFREGCWFAPTLITYVKPSYRIFQEESFGPIAVLVKAKDFDEAVKLCNAVPQGLSATLYSGDESEIQSFLDNAQAGILRINSEQAFFASDASFNGWKSSGKGIAEHGRWDRDFYTKVQTIYQK